jgi:hypothetical protein
VNRELPTLPEHLGSPLVFSGARVSRSLVLYVCLVHVAQTFVLFLGYSTILFLVCFFNSVAMVLSAIHRMMVISYRFAVFTRFFKSLHLDIFVT